MGIRNRVKAVSPELKATISAGKGNALLCGAPVHGDNRLLNFEGFLFRISFHVPLPYGHIIADAVEFIALGESHAGDKLLVLVAV